MAKRFTDTEKWKDGWFTDLKPEHKLIWYYLLDNCDNAGIYKLNMKMLNIMCDTNISSTELLSVFKNRLTQISDDKFLINKFCVYQYGNEFLDSTNKAVISAVDKLLNNNVIYFTGNMIEYTDSKDIKRTKKEYKISVSNGYTNNTLSVGNQYTIDTPSIPYRYPIDTPKEQEEVKVEETVKETVQEQYNEQKHVILENRDEGNIELSIKFDEVFKDV